MFNRQYAARDRRKSRRNARSLYYKARGSIEVLIAYKLNRTAPIPDVGFDACDLGMIDDHLNEYYRGTIAPEVWARYTTIVPFCTVPLGGTDPKKYGGVMRNPFRNPTAVKAEVALLKSMSAESKAKLSDELPPMPTFEEQLAKAGGRVIVLPNTSGVADWHEQDGSI